MSQLFFLYPIFRYKKRKEKVLENFVENFGDIFDDIMAKIGKVTTLLCGGTATKNLLGIAPIFSQFLSYSEELFYSIQQTA